MKKVYIISFSFFLLLVGSNQVLARCVYDNSRAELSIIKPDFSREGSWRLGKRTIYIDVLLPYFEAHRDKNSIQEANAYILRHIQNKINIHPNNKWFVILKKTIEKCISLEGRI